MKVISLDDLIEVYNGYLINNENKKYNNDVKLLIDKCRLILSNLDADILNKDQKSVIKKYLTGDFYSKMVVMTYTFDNINTRSVAVKMVSKLFQEYQSELILVKDISGYPNMTSREKLERSYNKVFLQHTRNNKLKQLGI